MLLIIAKDLISARVLLNENNSDTMLILICTYQILATLTDLIVAHKSNKKKIINMGWWDGSSDSLPNKCEALGSNPSTAKKRKKNLNT
jgi:hypothetical protein